ncbi:hypothetical protein A5631_07625 [Mycolicibacter heraklionensis]|nr:hypothetical protein A5631_07625 [Mycolicibacter heraklionensis]
MVAMPVRVVPAVTVVVAAPRPVVLMVLPGLVVTVAAVVRVLMGSMAPSRTLMARPAPPVAPAVTVAWVV